jgi:hypothetical protein
MVAHGQRTRLTYPDGSGVEPKWNHPPVEEVEGRVEAPGEPTVGRFMFYVKSVPRAVSATCKDSAPSSSCSS